MTLQTEQHMNINERQYIENLLYCWQKISSSWGVPYLIYVISKDLEFDIMVIVYA